MNNKTLKYRYTLETYDPKVRKHICPACGKRTFVRYADLETGEYVSTEVGRCDREQKCGYHKRPRDYFDENVGDRKKDYFFPRAVPKKASEDYFSVVSAQLAKDTMTSYEKNNLIAFIKSRWEKMLFRRLFHHIRLEHAAFGLVRLFSGSRTVTGVSGLGRLCFIIVRVAGG